MRLHLHFPKQTDRPSWVRVSVLVALACFSTVPVQAQSACPEAVLQAYLKASNTDAHDIFGFNVSVSGDTLAIGAHGESSAALGVNGDQSDDSAGDAGAVYVFVRSGTSWVQQAYLKASNTEAGDLFGIALSVSGDMLVVGASGEDSAAVGIDGDQTSNSLDGAGAAYVFVRNGSTWTQEAYIKAHDPGSSDQFGSSVALSGSTLCVGAFGQSLFSGAAYVFERSATGWQQQAYLTDPSPDAFDQFGVSVAVSGDTVVVGNPLDYDVSFSDVGAAHVFTRSGATWSLTGEVRPTAPHLHGFGGSVAVSGDTLLVGSGNLTSTAATVFVRAGSGWALDAFLEPFGQAATQYFGNTVALSGDTAVVSSCGSRSSAPGAVFVFERSGSGWSQRTRLLGFAASAGLASCAVAVSGDTVVLGSLSDDSGATGVNGDPGDTSAPDAGAGYVFELDAPIGSSYCIGGVNSTGVSGRICALGSADVSDDDLTLLATDLPPNRTGLFVYGAVQTQVPLWDGFQCVGSARRLFGALRTSYSGQAVRGIDFYADPVLSDITLTVPAQWNFQFWYRDAMGSSNLTDGVTVDFFD
jgi:hypothetical protein